MDAHTQISKTISNCIEGGYEVYYISFWSTLIIC